MNLRANSSSTSSHYRSLGTLLMSSLMLLIILMAREWLAHNGSSITTLLDFAALMSATLWGWSLWHTLYQFQQRFNDLSSDNQRLRHDNEALQRSADCHAQELEQTQQTTTRLAAKEAALSKLNNELRGEHSLKSTADLAIKHIAQTIDLPMLGIYLLNTAEKEFELISHSGYPSRPYQQMPLNHGLVGSCYQTQKTLLHAGPATQERIITGAQDLAPNQVIHIPLIYDETPLGVFEAFSLNPLSKEQVTWLEKAVDSLSIALQVAQANQHLNHSKALIQGVIDQLPSDIILLDDHQKVILINEKAAQRFAQTPEQVIGQSVQQLFDAQLLSLFEKLENDLQDARGSVQSEFKTAQGRLENIQLLPMQSMSDQQSQICCLINDLTAYQLQEQHTSKLIDSAPDAMVIVDATGTIRRINKQATNLFGYQTEEMVGQKLEMLIPERFRHHHPQQRASFFNNPTTREMGSGFELYGLNKSGDEFPIEISLSPIETEEGMWVSSAMRDITEKRQNTKQLEEAKRAAETATQAKSEFLANMSHEIRTPMNAIIGMSQLALNSDLNPRQFNYVSKVHRSATALLGIINDILDFSKIEAGKLSIENVPFNLEEVLSNLATVIGIQAEEKGIELLFSNTHRIPTQLIGDPLRLGQILTNLTNNSVKFTHEGEITLHIEVKDESLDSALLHFSISDTGIGMTEAQQERLFKSFSQADSSTTRKYGGTGLGLAISKHLIESMEGEIWVHSQPNEGSTFHFTARLGKQQNVKPRFAVTKESLHGLKALVVDDNRSSRQILQEMLSHMGVEVACCDSGPCALNICAQQPFDLILLDWQMPLMDGIETADKLQTMQLQQTPNIIIVTAYGREEVSEHISHNSLIKNVLSKPVTASTLLEALNPIFGHQEYISSHTHQNQRLVQNKRELANTHLLLVEDNDLNQELAIALLDTANIKVSVANDGQEAIDLINEQGDLFDGVLMDCQMPVLDGYSATEQLRQDPRWQDLPIIAMTANVMVEDRNRAFECGMNDLIGKPIDINDLFETLHKWVAPKHTEHTAEPQKISEQERLPLPMIEHLDASSGLKNCNRDRALYHRILCKFAHNKQDFVARFATTMAQQDIVKLHRMAHTLKGISGSVGATQVYDIAQHLEQKAMEADYEGMEQVLQQLDHELKPLITRTLEFCQQLEEVKVTPTLDAASLDSDRLTKDLTQLRSYLDDQEGEAITFAQEITSQLQAHPALTEFAHSLNLSIQQYDFFQAVEIVDKILEFLHSSIDG